MTDAPQLLRSFTAYHTYCRLHLTFLTILVLKGSDVDSKIRRRWSYTITPWEKDVKCFWLLTCATMSNGYIIKCLMLQSTRLGPPSVWLTTFTSRERNPEPIWWTTELDQRLILRRFLWVNVNQLSAVRQDQRTSVVKESSIDLRVTGTSSPLAVIQL